MFKAIIAKFFKKSSLKPVKVESNFTPSNGSFGYFADNGTTITSPTGYYDAPKGFRV